MHLVLALSIILCWHFAGATGSGDFDVAGSGSECSDVAGSSSEGFDVAGSGSEGFNVAGSGPENSDFYDSGTEGNVGSIRSKAGFFDQKGVFVHEYDFEPDYTYDESLSTTDSGHNRAYFEWVEWQTPRNLKSHFGSLNTNNPPPPYIIADLLLYLCKMKNFANFSVAAENLNTLPPWDNDPVWNKFVEDLKMCANSAPYLQVYFEKCWMQIDPANKTEWNKFIEWRFNFVAGPMPKGPLHPKLFGVWVRTFWEQMSQDEKKAFFERVKSLSDEVRAARLLSLDLVDLVNGRISYVGRRGKPRPKTDCPNFRKQFEKNRDNGLDIIEYLMQSDAFDLEALGEPARKLLQKFVRKPVSLLISCLHNEYPKAFDFVLVLYNGKIDSASQLIDRMLACDDHHYLISFLRLVRPEAHVIQWHLNKIELPQDSKELKYQFIIDFYGKTAHWLESSRSVCSETSSKPKIFYLPKPEPIIMLRLDKLALRPELMDCLIPEIILRLLFGIEVNVSPDFESLDWTELVSALNLLIERYCTIRRLWPNIHMVEYRDK